MADNVLVVGAGPTGLMLACELAAAGVRCRVLEQRDAEPNITRAFAVHARTLELLDARGLAQEVIAKGTPFTELQMAQGVRLDLRQADSRFAMVLMVPQSGTEQVLQARALQLGVPIVHGAQVEGLHQDADGAELTVRTADGTRRERAGYVVGADGAHSAVRGLLGVAFTGAQYQHHIMLADVRLADGPARALVGRVSHKGLALVLPFGDGFYRLILWDLSRQDVSLNVPLTLKEVRDACLRITGTDYGLHDPRWMSRFVSERRQAASYRVDRVFLAGDAAHVHSPLGGQGMNTGIQDAVNLGWKLAAAVHGWAPDWLLDSYQAERFPVGKSVLRVTDGLTRLVLSRSRLRQRLQLRLMSVLLRIPRVRRTFLAFLTGTGIAYHTGTGTNRLAGTRVPQVAAHNGQFVLVDSTGGLASLANSYRGRVVYQNAEPPARLPTATLVRPDGYAAWASDSTDPVTLTTDTRQALLSWCGAAAARSGTQPA